MKKYMEIKHGRLVLPGREVRESSEGQPDDLEGTGGNAHSQTQMNLMIWRGQESCSLTDSDEPDDLEGTGVSATHRLRSHLEASQSCQMVILL